MLAEYELDFTEDNPYASDPYASDPYASDPYTSDPYTSDPRHTGPHTRYARPASRQTAGLRGSLERESARQLALSALEAAAAGLADEALRQSSEAVDRAPFDSLVLCARARVLAELGSTSTATAFARRAVIAAPDLAQPHLVLARLLLQQSDFEEAHFHASRASALTPQNTEAQEICEAAQRFEALCRNARERQGTEPERGEVDHLSTGKGALWAVLRSLTRRRP